ncbi:DUF2550 domain-containing protein [Arcanobacterium haemolyticum]|nr:DUF2550 domain-containing protein [Arcanobacterium haemolyticum]
MGHSVDMTFLVVSLVILVLVVIGWCALRLMMLLRRPGSLQCSVRLGNAKPWRTGVLILGPLSLEWFNTRALLFAPSKVMERSGFSIVSHRPGGADNELTIADVTYEGSSFQIAMSPQSFAGLVSWIDAAPPSEEPTYI